MRSLDDFLAHRRAAGVPAARLSWMRDRFLARVRCNRRETIVDALERWVDDGGTQAVHRE